MVQKLVFVLTQMRALFFFVQSYYHVLKLMNPAIKDNCEQNLPHTFAFASVHRQFHDSTATTGFDHLCYHNKLFKYLE